VDQTRGKEDNQHKHREEVYPVKKVIFTLTLLIVVLLGTGIALAEGYEWRNHAPPFDLLFGNHIDTHQQSAHVDGNKLEGFFYIKFTGAFTDDGTPEAEHADCNMMPDQCTVGWILHGNSLRAKFVEHIMGQHPTWCVDPADLPRQPGYTHFHWLGTPEHAHGLVAGQWYDGYLLKLTARETFFFKHHGGFDVDPGIDYLTHANIVTPCP
jgi:hypothetical protein